MLRRKHGRVGTEPGRAAAQTARLLRPLRRREDRIERPARVRMRSRNPCTLWRRRLFGWYVRLLTTYLRWSGTDHAGASARSPEWRRTELIETQICGRPAVSAGTAHPRTTRCAEVCPTGTGKWHGHAAPVDTG